MGRKTKIPYIVLDDSPEHADWLRMVSWSLPPYKSPKFMALLDDIEMTLDEFRRLPKYKGAVERGEIVNDEWVGWTEGRVDTAKEHIEILYSDFMNEDGEALAPVARVAPAGKSRHSFVVEFLIRPEQPGAAEMLDAVRRELDFYLVEKCEPDPWIYAQYHATGTAANLYSHVHWILHKKSPST